MSDQTRTLGAQPQGERELPPLPCPFCGGEARVLPRTCNKDTPYNAADRAFPVVRCVGCHAEASGKDWSEPATAITAWNRRSAAGAQQGDDHAGSPAPSPVAEVKENPYCPEGMSDELTTYLPVGTKLYTRPQLDWKPLAESALALVKMDKDIQRITDEFGLDAPSAQSSKAALSDDEIDAANDLFNLAMYGDRGNDEGMRKAIRAILARAGITRKPLTEDAIYKLCGVEDRDALMKRTALYCVRAAERAHGIKESRDE